MRNRLYFIESILPHVDTTRTPVELLFFCMGGLGYTLFVNVYIVVTIIEQQTMGMFFVFYFMTILLLLIITNISAYRYTCNDRNFIKNLYTKKHKRTHSQKEYITKSINLWILANCGIIFFWPIAMTLSLVKYIRYCVYEPLLSDYFREDSNSNKEVWYNTLLKKIFYKEGVINKIGNRNNEI